MDRSTQISERDSLPRYRHSKSRAETATLTSSNSIVHRKLLLPRDTQPELRRWRKALYKVPQIIRHLMQHAHSPLDSTTYFPVGQSRSFSLQAVALRPSKMRNPNFGVHFLLALLLDRLLIVTAVAIFRPSRGQKKSFVPNEAQGGDKWTPLRGLAGENGEIRNVLVPPRNSVSLFSLYRLSLYGRLALLSPSSLPLPRRTRPTLQALHGNRFVWSTSAL